MSQGGYLPEGLREMTSCVDHGRLAMAMRSGEIIEGVALSCTPEHDLIVDMGEGIEGVIPYPETAVGLISGRTRDIAVISRVGRPVCFKVMAKEGSRYILSRRLAQQEALEHYKRDVKPGDVICGIITHLEPFGAFVDIGCGIISMIGVENISVSRIKHSSERFGPGQRIYAVVTGVEGERISLSHRELLGTWEENAARISAGQTRIGIVRSIESYGAFIELTPNLSGLAENRPGLVRGGAVSVYVKSIMPEKMKIKLSVIEDLGTSGSGMIKDSDYYIKSGRVDLWEYSPRSCRSKYIATRF